MRSFASAVAADATDADEATRALRPANLSGGGARNSNCAQETLFAPAGKPREPVDGRGAACEHNLSVSIAVGAVMRVTCAADATSMTSARARVKLRSGGRRRRA